MNEMQQALDVSLEAYFAELTRNQVDLKVGSLNDSTASNLVYNSSWITDTASQGLGQAMSFLKNQDSTGSTKQNLFQTNTSSAIIIDSDVSSTSVESIDISSYFSADDSFPKSGMMSGNIEFNLKDSLEQIKGFAQKIILSLSKKELELDSLKTFLSEELERRKMDVDHLLVLYRNRIGPIEVNVQADGNKIVKFEEKRDTLYSQASFEEEDFPLKVLSNSTFLSKDQKLALKFENASLTILKRGGIDLFVSLLISLIVIGAMLYLYRIISQQKELAEIKNDLISNITHEFKTPIATISTAMEGISNFNQANDLEKTNKYLGISKDQLKKLNGMVEKLLETASLDSNDLEIAREEVEVVSFTRQIYEKFKVISGEKTLSLETDLEEFWSSFDPFHMENAIANLLDNALKYGGENVQLRLRKTASELIWEVEDNGGQIQKQEQERIFDKFYRIPTGNVHNVKGFGIGLYYTKTLIEKHGGNIQLEVKKGSTVFTIRLNHVES